jgi:hypothetical protein
LPIRDAAARILCAGREGREILLRCNMGFLYPRRRDNCKYFFALHKNF